jgi:hypothetical protein
MVADGILGSSAHAVDVPRIGSVYIMFCFRSSLKKTLTVMLIYVILSSLPLFDSARPGIGAVLPGLLCGSMLPL